GEDSNRSGRFLRASDLGNEYDLPEWKTVVWDEHTGEMEIPNGSQAYRWDNDNKWNLELEKEDGSFIDPLLTFIDQSDETVLVHFPYFAEETGNLVQRGVPVKHIQDENGNTVKVTTVYDLMMAHTGVDRGIPGD